MIVQFLAFAIHVPSMLQSYDGNFRLETIKHTFSIYQIHVDIVLYCIMITSPPTQSDQERREVGEKIN